VISKKVLITASEVLAIPIRDNGEPLVEVSGIKAVAAPDLPLKIKDYKMVRQGVLEKLIAAQSLLPEGYSLRLYEGYRSVQVQAIEFNMIFDKTKRLFPDFSDEQLFVETTKLASPVQNLDGTINVPTHSTGAAVDVDIVDRAGQPLNFGMQISDWITVDPELCETDTRLVDDEASRNRQLLNRVMQQVGFVNYFTEWWHFSYGDRYWAYLTGNTVALYGGATQISAASVRLTH
jgi:D-alanyl-D-alanine dipeptidase